MWRHLATFATHTAQTFPALQSLHARGELPKDTTVVGYARTKMEQADFHSKISGSMRGTEEEKQNFLKLCTYVSGQYDEDESFQRLAQYIEKIEKETGTSTVNRVFYMALPPNVFTTVSTHLRRNCYSEQGHNRVIVEKPFGKDLESCEKMISDMKKIWSEQETFRIDHYLGKEMVKNLLRFRLSNPVIENVLNHNFVDNVQITFKEPFGTAGRGGYFDEFGIIRDIQQNHLCQVFSLLAMDAPEELSAESIRTRKVEVLKQVRPLDEKEVVIGQYSAANGKPGYKEDDTVPKDSNTPTFAAFVLRVDNDRWKDVPFVLQAGKALDEGVVLIRVTFKNTAQKLFPDAKANELIIRIQPNEGVFYHLNNKLPGTAPDLVPADLSLVTKEAFKGAPIPEAYESLILDAVRGDQSNFVRDDELFVSWGLLTPLLHHIDAGKCPCVTYPYGSKGPAQMKEFYEKLGIIDGDMAEHK